MDCTEPDVVAPDESRDNSSIHSRAQDIGNSSTNSEAEDIDKRTSVNDEAEEACHNVSVPLFTAK